MSGYARVQVVAEYAAHLVDRAETAAGAVVGRDPRGVVNDVGGIAGRLSYERRLSQVRRNALETIILPPGDISGTDQQTEYGSGCSADKCQSNLLPYHVPRLDECNGVVIESGLFNIGYKNLW